MNWQPISTAPKDGKPMDVWSVSRMRCSDVIRWDTTLYIGWDLEGKFIVNDATHWKRDVSPEEEERAEKVRGE